MDIDDDMCDEDMGDSDMDDHSTTEDDAKSGVSRQSKGKNGSSHGNSSSKPRRLVEFFIIQSMWMLLRLLEG